MRWLLILSMANWLVKAQFLPLQHISPPGSQLYATRFMEDDQGMLWIGAQQGLFRYEGRNLVDMATRFGLPEGDWILLGKDTRGGIWLACPKGLYRFADGQFEFLTRKTYGGIAFTRQAAILTERPSSDEADEPLEFLDLAEWERTHTWRTTPVPATGRGVVSIDRSGAAWFGCGAGICQLDSAVPPFGQVHKYGESNGLPRGAWSSVLRDSSQRIWARDREQLYASSPRGDHFAPIPGVQGIGGGQGLEEAPDGSVWAAGSQMIVQATATKTNYFPRRSFEPVDAIFSIFHDRAGDAWLGLSTGPVRWLGGGLVSNWGAGQGLVGIAVNFARTTSGQLYAGAGKGLYRMNEDLNWSVVAGAGDLRAPRLTAQSDGSLLIASRPSRTALPRFYLLEHDRIRALSEAEHRRFGIVDYTFADRRLGAIVTPHPDQAAPLEFPADPGKVRVYRFDRHGKLWLAANGGLFVTDLKGKWRHFTHADGLLETNLQALGIAPDGSIWIGYDTPVGFSRLDSPGLDLNQPPHWRHFQTAHTYGAGTFCFGFDSHGRVWRGTGSGIEVSDGIHLEPGDWAHIGREDGFASEDTAPDSFWLDKDGAVWIGSAGGMTRFDAAFFGVTPLLAKLALAEQHFDRTARRLRISLAVSPLGVGRKLHIESRLSPEQKTWQSAAGLDIEVPVYAAGPHRFEVRIVETPWIKPAVGVTFDFETPYPISFWWWFGALPVTAFPVFFWKSLRLRRHYARVKMLHEELIDASPADRAARLNELPADICGELQEIFAESKVTGDLSGEILEGRFLLEHHIVEGGFGKVYYGRDLAQGREPVAVKILRGRTDGTRGRWEPELQILEQLRHPGIVQPRAGGLSESLGPYLVTKYVDGITLQAAMTRGRMAGNRMWLRIWELCDALEYAHRNGVLHCDLKPSNIMIRDFGGPEESSVIIDFGGSIFCGGGARTLDATSVGGTPGYLAPEQLTGNASTASDVYSLAVIIVEMFTGVRWQAGASAAEFETILAEMPRLHGPLKEALALNPSERIRSAEQFRNALRASLGF